MNKHSKSFLAALALALLATQESTAQPLPKLKTGKQEIGLTLSSPQVTGGTAVKAKVRLNLLPSRYSLTLTLSSSDPAAVSLPATVVIPENQLGAEFTVETHPVTTNRPVQIILGFPGGVASTPRPDLLRATLTVLAPVLTSFTTDRSSVISPDTVKGELTLSGPAPAGGLSVNMASQNADVMKTPPTVTVPAGGTGTTVSIEVRPVAAVTNVEIRATVGTVVKTTILTAKVGVASVTINPGPNTGGSTVTGKITLTGPAPAGGASIFLGFKQTSPCFDSCCPPLLQQNVTISAGATEAPFEFKLLPTNNAFFAVYTNYSGRHSDWFNGAGFLQVVAPWDFTFEVPAQIRSGQTAIGKIKLNGLMPPNGCTNIWYMLKPSDTSVIQVPSQVVVAPGSSESLFEIKAATVSANQTVTMSMTRVSPGSTPGTKPAVSITVTP